MTRVITLVAVFFFLLFAGLIIFHGSRRSNPNRLASSSSFAEQGNWNDESCVYTLESSLGVNVRNVKPEKQPRAASLSSGPFSLLSCNDTPSESTFKGATTSESTPGRPRVLCR
ncbi:unnamed protein product [Amoebophrya sp. A25]|nr:unnamed protein product [Amoebophrya sp. A25]|eukprot:GSA25T00009180001.1